MLSLVGGARADDQRKGGTDAGQGATAPLAPPGAQKKAAGPKPQGKADGGTPAATPKRDAGAPAEKPCAETKPCGIE
jgi:hypothetical protein